MVASEVSETDVASATGDHEAQDTSPQLKSHPSSTVAMFRQFAAVLDDKYDRHERLVKLSRDVTVESKRIIYQLHRASSDPSALDKAADRLHAVRERFFHRMAVELDGLDKHYYVRAFSPGLQEFIEAYGFYKFLKDGTLVTHEDLQNDIFTFKVYCDTGYQCSSNKFSRQVSAGKPRGGGRGGGRGGHARERNVTYVAATESAAIPIVSTSEIKSPDIEAANGPLAATEPLQEKHVSVQASTPQPKDGGDTKMIQLFLPQSEFLLGLCDIPGELMRACILAVANGNKDFAFKTCHLIQQFYAGCVGLTTYKLNSKLPEMRRSVYKMEYSCYSLGIRDSKSKPSFFTADVFDDSNHGEDYDSGNE